MVAPVALQAQQMARQTVPLLSEEKDFTTWLWKNGGNLKNINPQVKTDFDAAKAQTGAGAPDDIVIADAALNVKYRSYEGTVFNALTGAAGEIAAGATSESLVSIVRELERQWDEKNTADRTDAWNDFNNVKWNPKKVALHDWWSTKQKQLRQCTPQYSADAAMGNRNLNKVLGSMLPASYDPVMDQIRHAGEDAPWAPNFERVRSWMKTRNGKPEEVTGTAFHGTTFKKALREFFEDEDNVLSMFGGRFPSLKDDRNNKPNYRNVRKGGKGKKGDGKKGGGKLKNPHLKCDHCDRAGHTVENCWDKFPDKKNGFKKGKK
jgi:hypothetical protein